MRVTLVFPQFDHVTRKGDNTLPPYGIFYLAAILRKHGHQVRIHTLHQPDIFDPHFVSSLVDDCDVLGLSANTINWRILRKFAFVARSLRQNLPIVLGGIHPSIFDQHALSTTPADYIIRGEGEIALLEVLDALNGNRKFCNIGGLTYRDKLGNIHTNPSRPLLTKRELATQPIPAFDLLPPNEYHGLSIESSRGCAFNCVFCSIPYQRSFRSLEAEIFVSRLVQSVDIVGPKLISPWGKTSVYILDDCFTTSKRRVIEIFERLLPQRNCIRIGIEARADQITEDMTKIMAEYDFWLIQLGIESGYSKGLRRINKGLCIEDVERSCRILKDYGLSDSTNYAFMIGLPWETKKDCLRTLEFAIYLHLNFGGHISISWYEPFPGSPLWDRRTEEKLPITLETYDDPDFDWRSDVSLFRSIRPRLSWSDIHEIEEVISSMAALDSKYLLNFPYFHSKRYTGNLAYRVRLNNSI